MKSLIEFPLEDGTSILVEVDELTEGVVRAARPDGKIERAKQTFEQAIDHIRPAASVIIKKLRSLHDQPDEIQVVFGLKLNSAANAFIASAAIEANYTVTLKWTNRPAESTTKPAATDTTKTKQ